jgi:hypothetical protein
MPKSFSQNLITLVTQHSIVGIRKRKPLSRLGIEMNFLERHGSLTIVRTDPTLKGTAKRVVAVCECGSVRSYQLNNIRTGRTSSCGCQSGFRGGVRQETPSYEAIHKRLKHHNGSASNYICTCGAPAREWAWQGCQQPLSSPMRNRTTPMGYCTHQEHYKAMCAKCHHELDHPRALSIAA